MGRFRQARQSAGQLYLRAEHRLQFESMEAVLQVPSLFGKLLLASRGLLHEVVELHLQRKETKSSDSTETGNFVHRSSTTALS